MLQPEAGRLVRWNQLGGSIRLFNFSGKVASASRRHRIRIAMVGARKRLGLIELKVVGLATTINCVDGQLSATGLADLGVNLARTKGESNSRYGHFFRHLSRTLSDDAGTDICA